MVHGHLNESQVNVLRDTGCSGVVVRRDLIRPDQFTGEKNILVMINRSVISTQVARCSFNSLYFQVRPTSYVLMYGQSYLRCDH